MDDRFMRYRTLDSVRGVAALTVLLHHVAMTFPGGGEHRQELFALGFRAHESWLYGTPLRLLVSGPAAVMLFFVLSGFVLTLNLSSTRQPSYGSFAIARFARIWIPFAIAIMFAAVLNSFLATRPAPGTSPMFANNWHEPLTLANIARHLMMTGSVVDLDGPMWSLVHELRISFVFPLLVLLTARSNALCLVGSMLMSITCVWLVGRGGLGHLTSFLQTATYVYFFVIGILIASHAHKIRALLVSLPRKMLACLWILALGGLSFGPPDTSHVAAVDDGLILLFSGLSAGLVIALCIVGGAAERILMTPVPRFLGRISYSLYLTHVIVLVAVIHAVGGTWPLPVSIGIALPLVFIIADVFQRYVEAPSQRLGKISAERFDRRESVAPIPDRVA